MLLELRLVLLGRTGGGKSSAGNNILGLQAFQSQHASDAAIPQECQKHRGEVAGRKVSYYGLLQKIEITQPKVGYTHYSSASFIYYINKASYWGKHHPYTVVLLVKSI